MAYNVISYKEIQKTLKKSKYPILLDVNTAPSSEITKNHQKNFALNHNLLNLFMGIYARPAVMSRRFRIWVSKEGRRGVSFEFNDFEHFYFLGGNRRCRRSSCKWSFKVKVQSLFNINCFWEGLI